MRAYLLGLFRTPRPKVEPSARQVLDDIRRLVETKNIPVIMDDVDAGYDMAVDEILDLIEDYQRLHFPHAKKEI